MRLNIFARKESLPSNLPSQQDLEEFGQISKYTPDFRLIEQTSHQNVFVYGRDMTNRPEFNASVSERQYTAFTLPQFSLWEKKLGKESYPVALKSHLQKNLIVDGIDRQLAPTNRIKGEVHKIQATHLYKLDKMRENGVQFQRMRVAVVVPYRTLKVQTLKQSSMEVHIESHMAWMYVGLPEYWEEQLDAGYTCKPSPIIRARNEYIKKYYAFEEGI